MQKISHLLALLPLILMGCSSSGLRPIEEVWDDTNFESEELSFIYKRRCFRETTFFLGCVDGLNLVLLDKKSKLLLIPRKNFKKLTRFINKEANQKILGSNSSWLSDFMIVNSSEGFIKSFSKLFSRWPGRFRNIYTRAWIDHYNLGKEIKLYELLGKVISFAKEKGIWTEANDSFYASKIYNIFLSTSIDRYSYLTPIDKKLKPSDSQGFEKILGMYFTLDKNKKALEIKTVVPGSAIEEAKLYYKDKIMAYKVNGEDPFIYIKDSGFDKALEDIQNPESEKFTFLIKPFHGKKEKTLNIEKKGFKRDLIQKKALSVKKKKVLYLKLLSFRSNELCKSFEKWPKELAGFDAMVLDLRDNPGGYVEAASCLASIFLGEVSLILTLRELKYGMDKPTVFSGVSKYFSNNRFGNIKIPLIILQNEDSASASEIVAGALKDHNRAIIVGKTSYGKGTAQSNLYEHDLVPYARKNLDVLFYTTKGLSFRPSGELINYEGVHPDFIVDEFLKKKKKKFELQSWLDNSYDLKVKIKGKKTRPVNKKSLVTGKIRRCVRKRKRSSIRRYRKEDKQLKRLSSPDFQLMRSLDIFHCIL